MLAAVDTQRYVSVQEGLHVPRNDVSVVEAEKKKRMKNTIDLDSNTRRTKTTRNSVSSTRMRRTRRMLRRATSQTVQAARTRSHEAETQDGLDEPAFKAHEIDDVNSHSLWNPRVCGNLTGPGAV
ncbi:unnamed protein product [Prorocentrum cordatum]|uniref:Uncharacterized protein n=1 Tax=Prorocentrum cordatum TaxID=2364126 RepID=A0ABN9RJ29_9DINO|nr:unnamed protein product [Polarella glacialis]